MLPSRVGKTRGIPSLREKAQYASSQVGIAVPVVLANGPLQIKLEAKIDTGADFCFFNSSYAEALGLDLQQGIPKTMAVIYLTK